MATTPRAHPYYTNPQAVFACQRRIRSEGNPIASTESGGMIKTSGNSCLERHAGGLIGGNVVESSFKSSCRDTQLSSQRYQPADNMDRGFIVRAGVGESLLQKPHVNFKSHKSENQTWKNPPSLPSGMQVQLRQRCHMSYNQTIITKGVTKTIGKPHRTRSQGMQVQIRKEIQTPEAIHMMIPGS